MGKLLLFVLLVVAVIVACAEDAKSRATRGQEEKKEVEKKEAEETSQEQRSIPAKQPYPRKSYRFGYDVIDKNTGHQFRQETQDPDGAVRGSYGFQHPHGHYRLVHYVADGKGFRVVVRSNEPGISRQRPANVDYIISRPQVAYSANTQHQGSPGVPHSPPSEASGRFLQPAPGPGPDYRVPPEITAPHSFSGPPDQGPPHQPLPPLPEEDLYQQHPHHPPYYPPEGIPPPDLQPAGHPSHLPPAGHPSQLPPAGHLSHLPPAEHPSHLPPDEHPSHLSPAEHPHLPPAEHPHLLPAGHSPHLPPAEHPQVLPPKHIPPPPPPPEGETSPVLPLREHHPPVSIQHSTYLPIEHYPAPSPGVPTGIYPPQGVHPPGVPHVVQHLENSPYPSLPAIHQSPIHVPPSEFVPASHPSPIVPIHSVSGELSRNVPAHAPQKSGPSHQVPNIPSPFSLNSVFQPHIASQKTQPSPASYPHFPPVQDPPRPLPQSQPISPDGFNPYGSPERTPIDGTIYQEVPSAVNAHLNAHEYQEPYGSPQSVEAEQVGGSFHKKSPPSLSTANAPSPPRAFLIRFNQNISPGVYHASPEIIDPPPPPPPHVATQVRPMGKQITGPIPQPLTLGRTEPDVHIVPPPPLRRIVITSSNTPQEYQNSQYGVQPQSNYPSQRPYYIQENHARYPPPSSVASREDSGSFLQSTNDQTSYHDSSFQKNPPRMSDRYTPTSDNRVVESYYPVSDPRKTMSSTSENKAQSLPLPYSQNRPQSSLFQRNTVPIQLPQSLSSSVTGTSFQKGLTVPVVPPSSYAYASPKKSTPNRNSHSSQDVRQTSSHMDSRDIRTQTEEAKAALGFVDNSEKAMESQRSSSIRPPVIPSKSMVLYDNQGRRISPQAVSFHLPIYFQNNAGRLSFPESPSPYRDLPKSDRTDIPQCDLKSNTQTSSREYW